MAYTINKSNGQILLTLQDGTVDAAKTSLTLVGKNYPGYGEIFNENIVHLLDNFAAPTPPRNPLTGQIWYNTSTNKLNVYNGSSFKDTVSTTYSDKAPTRSATGDFWFKSDSSQLFVYNGNNFTLIGPTIAQNNIRANDINATGVITAQDIVVNDDLVVGDKITADEYESTSLVGGRVLYTETVGENARFVTKFTFAFDDIGNILSVPGLISEEGLIDVVRVAGGTAATPSITSKTNTNTGILFPDTNQIAFSCGALEGLRINAGKLAIGLTAPAEKLHLVGNFAIGGNPGANRSGRLSANDLLPEKMSMRQEFGTDGTGWRYSIAKNVSGTITDLVHIVDSGNVGIGTSEPSENLTLFSVAEAKLGLKTSNQAYVLRLLESDGSIRLTRTVSGNTDFITVTNAGNVGVGTTVPQYKVDVVGDVNVSGNYLINGVPLNISTGEIVTAVNLGNGGYEVFSAKVGSELQFRRLYPGTGVNITSTDVGLFISSTGGGGSGEANTASNLDTPGAAAVFASKVGVDLQFRRIAGGTGIEVTEYPNYITIAATGGGGGGGGGGTPIDVIDDTTTDANRYITFSNQAASTLTQLYVSSGKLLYNPNSGIVTGVDFVSTSDARLKNVLGPIDDSLGRLSQINGVRYTWNALAEQRGILNNSEQIGVLAQEVEAVLPQAVTEADGYKSVNYDKLVPVLIEAIKQLNIKVEDLQKQLANLG